MGATKEEMQATKSALRNLYRDNPTNTTKELLRMLPRDLWKPHHNTASYWLRDLRAERRNTVLCDDSLASAKESSHAARYNIENQIKLALHGDYKNGEVILPTIEKNEVIDFAMDLGWSWDRAYAYAMKLFLPPDVPNDHRGRPGIAKEFPNRRSRRVKR